MSEHEPEKRTADQERTRETLRGAASFPRPDAAFRERLKEAFVSGQFTNRPEGTHQRVLPLRRPWFARPAMRGAIAVAAAAVVIVVAGFLNRGPDWRVTAATGTGAVTIEGEPIAIENLDALRARLRPGVEVNVPHGGALELTSAGQLAVYLTPGTELTVPPPPSRWFARSTELYARKGKLHITTGPRFEGAQLSVHTPEADVEVVGTTLAVIMEPVGTCVCVLEGSVKMGEHGGSLMDVAAGARCFVYNDGRPAEMGEIRPMERMKLAMFRDVKRPELEGARPD